MFIMMFILCVFFHFLFICSLAFTPWNDGHQKSCSRGGSLFIADADGSKSEVPYERCDFALVALNPVCSPTDSAAVCSVAYVSMFSNN